MLCYKIYSISKIFFLFELLLVIYDTSICKTYVLSLALLNFVWAFLKVEKKKYETKIFLYLTNTFFER